MTVAHDVFKHLEQLEQVAHILEWLNRSSAASAGMNLGTSFKSHPINILFCTYK